MKLIFGITLFMIGLYIVSTYAVIPEQEGFKTPNIKCPNLLIQKNNLLYLYHKNEPETPGVNPLVFQNLEEYVEHIEYQRSKGIRCPVLFLQHIMDAQGTSKYKIYPSPFDTAGLPQSTSSINIERGLVNAGFDKGSYPSFDETQFDEGVYTPLDAIQEFPDKISDSAMDTHWGGVSHSRESVDSGKYDMNTRKINT